MGKKKPVNTTPNSQAPAPITALREWHPIEPESGESRRSMIFSLGLHVAIVGLLWVGFKNADVQAQELSGEPIEVIMTGDLAKTKLEVISTVARMPTKLPRVKVESNPRSDVNDLRQTPPPVQTLDPMAIERAEEQQKQEEQARAQRELDELMRQQSKKEELVRKEREALIAAQEAAERARTIKLMAQEEEIYLSGTSSNDDLLALYVSALHGRIKQAARVPIALEPGIKCMVAIKQAIGGEVLDVYPTRECNASLDQQNQLIESIRRASPLPYEEFKTVFRENLILPFAGN